MLETEDRQESSQCSRREGEPIPEDTLDPKNINFSWISERYVWEMTAITERKKYKTKKCHVKRKANKYIKLLKFKSRE